jgi:GNAT superfamily N-acetyltransferase
MEGRCFFVVENSTNRAVGTAMAWYAPEFVEGENYGRVHWVSMIPEFQGKGLAKPMMTAVLNRLAQSHTKAVLGTQTFRKAAVRLYLNFGFLPFFKNPTCRQAWSDLAEELKHPALERYRI